MTESSLFAITVSCHPTEPALKPCPKMLLFGVSCSGSSRTCFGIWVLEKPWLGVRGWGLERATENRITTEWFSVLRIRNLFLVLGQSEKTRDSESSSDDGIPDEEPRT